MDLLDLVHDARESGDLGKGVSDDGSQKGYYGNGGKASEYDSKVGKILVIVGCRYNPNGGDCEVIILKLNGKRIGWAKLEGMLED